MRRLNAKLNPDGASQEASVDLGQMDQQQLLSLLSGESPAPNLSNPAAVEPPSADVEMSENVSSYLHRFSVLPMLCLCADCIFLEGFIVFAWTVV